VKVKPDVIVRFNLKAKQDSPGSQVPGISTPRRV
jgi:hypothetical protein